MLRLLDTDTCVFALRHHAGVLERLRALSPDDVAVCVVTEAELEYGVLASRDPARSRRSVEAFLAPIASLPFESGAAPLHAAIRLALKSKPIGERDLIIAAVALAHDATLVTHNGREFGRVRGLRVEDWVG